MKIFANKPGIYLISILWLSLVVACSSDAFFEQSIDLPKEGWTEENTLDYEFQILDTKPKYDVYCNIRYTTDYRFFNNYVNYELLDSNGVVISKHLDQFILFEEKSGKPIGSGLGGVYDLNSKLFYFNNFTFPYSGKYTFRIKQYMRITPLMGIKAVGIKIKKI